MMLKSNRADISQFLLSLAPPLPEPWESLMKVITVPLLQNYQARVVMG